MNLTSDKVKFFGCLVRGDGVKVLLGDTLHDHQGIQKQVLKEKVHILGQHRVVAFSPLWSRCRKPLCARLPVEAEGWH